MHDLLPPPYRDCTLDDLPWVLSLGYERYESFDPGAALTFLLNVINSPQGLLIRTDRAFLIAAKVIPPWRPKSPECHVVVICAAEGAHWQAARLARASVEWARKEGCKLWRLHSETHHDVGAVCRWVGAHMDSPRYVLELED